MIDQVNNRAKKLVNRETLAYAFFGIITSVENIILFKIFSLSLNYKIANLITLVIVKVTAYICNKNFVFHSKTGSWIELIKEFGRFVVARGITMLLDYFGLILLVEFVRADAFLSKCIITILIVIINYFVGKRHVFKHI